MDFNPSLEDWTPFSVDSEVRAVRHHRAYRRALYRPLVPAPMSPKDWLTPGQRFGIGGAAQFIEVADAEGYQQAGSAKRLRLKGSRRAALVQHRFFVHANGRLARVGYRSWKQVANELDISPKTLYNYTSGQRYASVELLGQIEALLGPILPPADPAPGTPAPDQGTPPATAPTPATRTAQALAELGYKRSTP